MQDGIGAWEYVRRTCSPAVTQIKLREMSQQWDSLDLMAEVGMNEHSISQMASRIRTINGRMPIAHRRSEDAQATRLLECIFTASKHFMEGALVEYNAPAGERKYQKLDGTRDLNKLVAAYDALWQQAVSG